MKLKPLLDFWENIVISRTINRFFSVNYKIIITKESSFSDLKIFNKIFKLLKKKIFSTNNLNPKNGDEVEMLVKGIFEEKEETMSTAAKWFQSFETNINIRLDKIEKRLDVIEEDIKVLKKDMIEVKKDISLMKNTPTMKQELSLNMTQA